MSIDCLACHGGSILGQSYIGLGNASLDVQALFEDLNAGSGLPTQLPCDFQIPAARAKRAACPFTCSPIAMRTSAFASRPSIWNCTIRCARTRRLVAAAQEKDHVPDRRSQRPFGPVVDAIHDGVDQRSCRIDKAEADFADIQQFIDSLRPPKYPFAIDQALAGKGEAIFQQTCARPTAPMEIMDLSEQNRCTRRDRHGPGPVLWHLGQVREVL